MTKKNLSITDATLLTMLAMAIAGTAYAFTTFSSKSDLDRVESAIEKMSETNRQLEIVTNRLDERLKNFQELLEVVTRHKK